jgi:CHASE3 domain sensor protein
MIPTSHLTSGLSEVRERSVGVRRLTVDNPNQQRSSKCTNQNADLERKVAERTVELAERAKDLERSNMELQQFAANKEDGAVLV